MTMQLQQSESHTSVANSNTQSKSVHKKWLLGAIAAAALTLGACADKNETPMTDAEPTADAQTPVEQAETGVATADMPSNDVAVATADPMDPANDDVAVATADDTEVLDGTESEEHVSTY